MKKTSKDLNKILKPINYCTTAFDSGNNYDIEFWEELNGYCIYKWGDIKTFVLQKDLSWSSNNEDSYVCASMLEALLLINYLEF